MTILTYDGKAVVDSNGKVIESPNTTGIIIINGQAVIINGSVVKN